MRVSALSPRAAALLLLAAVCLIARVASAGLYLAPTTAYTPLANFSQLAQACAAQYADGLPLAMYDASLTSSVVQYMNSQKTTTAFVSAQLSIGGAWIWEMTESGNSITMTVNTSQFLPGELDKEKTNYRYAAFDASRNGLITTTRYGGYPVLCNSQKFAKVPSKGFPWWGILIIVLGAVVVVAVIVIVIVCCCCCKKKKSYDDADDEDGSSSAFTSRSGSFVSGSTSRSSKRDGSSSSFSTSQGTSFSASQSDASSVGSDSESGGSSLASGSHGTSRSGATSQSTRSSSTGGAFSDVGAGSYADPHDTR